MKKQILPLLLSFGFSFFSFADTNYVVRRGDTILKIADRTIGIENNKKDPRRFTFMKSILAKNPSIKDPNAITPGQSILIPDYEKPTSLTPAPLVAKPETAVATQPQAQPHAQSTPAVVEQAPPVPPTLVKAPHGEEGHHNFFVLQLRGSSDSYKMKSEVPDQQLALTSQISSGLGLGYGIAVGAHSHVLIKGGATYTHLEKLKYKKPENSGLTPILNDPKQWMKNVGLGYEYAFLPSLRMHLLAQWSERLFILLDEETNSFTAKAIGVPVGELALEWDYLQMPSSSLGINVGGEYLSSVKHNGLKYKAAFDPIGALYWKSNFGHDSTNYRVALTYAHGEQHPENFDQGVTSYGLTIDFIF